MIDTLDESAPPLKRSQSLSIAIPASFVSDNPHLREKTFRISMVGRAASIFRVNEVIIYPDMPKTNQNRDINLIATILTYMEAPQYLRKRLFKIQPELQYAGVLPPLRTPHHPLANRIKDLTVGEYREGAVVFHSQQGSLVDVGVEQPILVANTKLKQNTRVTLRIVDLGEHPRAVPANLQEIQSYWGYKVTASDVSFGKLVRRKPFDLIVATSRKGKPMHTVIDELAARWKQSHKTLVAFGAPTKGLFEIAADEHVGLEDLAHFIVNTLPKQGTETVRTEEALYASLALLNTLD